MKAIATVCLSLFLFASCKQHESNPSEVVIIAQGKMPAITKDENQNIHLVYGKGDSIMYMFSKNKGVTFSIPELVTSLKDLVAYATRGPQISISKKGVAIIAADRSGNIFSYLKDQSGKWVKTARVNDADTTDKEGFLTLSSSDQNNLFAVWTDLRNDHRNKIYGSRSGDGGSTWQKNMLVYASPDSTICECCKPSVAMDGNKIIVMFRNWLKGNRDLYLIQSFNAGETFGEAEKLGNGSWALDGCPMDGGGLAFNDKGIVQTVWRRQSKIYSCEPGKQEKEIGEGKSCCIETLNGRNIYAWCENNDIICLLPDGSTKSLGKGSLPLIKPVSNDEFICIWEDEGQIKRTVVHL